MTVRPVVRNACRKDGRATVAFRRQLIPKTSEETLRLHEGCVLIPTVRFVDAIEWWSDNKR